MTPYGYVQSSKQLGFIITFKDSNYLLWPQTEIQTRHQVKLLNEAYNLGNDDGLEKGYKHGFEDNECGCGE